MKIIFNYRDGHSTEPLNIEGLLISKNDSGVEEIKVKPPFSVRIAELKSISVLEFTK